MTLRRFCPQAAIPTARIANDKNSPALRTVAKFPSLNLIRTSLYFLFPDGPRLPRGHENPIPARTGLLGAVPDHASTQKTFIGITDGQGNACRLISEFLLSFAAVGAPLHTQEPDGSGRESLRHLRK